MIRSFPPTEKSTDPEAKVPLEPICAEDVEVVPLSYWTSFSVEMVAVPRGRSIRAGAMRPPPCKIRFPEIDIFKVPGEVMIPLGPRIKSLKV